jgi:hypothetical protein
MAFELIGITAQTWGLLTLLVTLVILFATHQIPVDVTAMACLLALVVGG